MRVRTGDLILPVIPPIPVKAAVATVYASALIVAHASRVLSGAGPKITSDRPTMPFCTGSARHTAIQQHSM
jgi:hypothetical protein